ncbi:hypothetical protein AURDEDRAFT_120142 [Auricularia subglabra TFB-10046 SS5]|nr:hypothetical protein AURDEDRAFT_120142 [Auricularia subglabra TFB-10046 SS5]
MSSAPLPTAAQAGATRQLIANRHREIESAEEQIRQHESHISALRLKIDKMHDEIVAAEAYLAPVRRLPFEVLGEIVALLATDPHAPVQVLRHLASVCNTWRKATLRTPKAWTNVNIDIPSPRSSRRDENAAGPRKTLQTLRDVQEWYDRSGCRKKDVTLCAESENDQVVSILELVLSRSSELRTFVPSLYLKGGLARHLSRPMPALQALDVSFVTLDQDVLSPLTRASRLSCLRMDRLPSADILVPLQTRLKSLEISEISAESFFCMLRAGTGLVNLQALCASVPIDHLAGSLSLDESVIPLPNLRTLFLEVEDITIPFLEMMQMPRLESLAVSRESSTRNATKKQTSDKVIDALSAKQPGKPARWICPNLSRICIISDSSSKSDKFRVTQDGMGALVTARLRANLSTPRRAAGPAVVRLMDVRLDNHDAVFSSILSVDWTWKLDEEESFGFDNIDPRHFLCGEPRWWHCQSNWEEI